MSNIAKAGLFSDGGHRFRVVQAGYSADPAPVYNKIVFDSDWPEVLTTANGYFGTVSVTSSNSVGSGGVAGAVSFTALPFDPFVNYAIPFSAVNYPYTSPFNSTAAGTALASAYQVRAIEQATSTSGFSVPYTEASGNYAYTCLWAAFMFDPGFSGAGSRAGTQWMEWTANGPVVAKPGKNISSSNPQDFLIPPASSGYILGQLQAVATVSSLPYEGTFSHSGSTYYDYLLTVPHGLSYVPIVVISQSAQDFRTSAPTLSDPIVYVDSTNIYVYAYNVAYSSNLSVIPVTYFVTRARWV